jgi:hypothetical protein
MWHSPSWLADVSSTNQEFPCILWNPKFLYCVHNSRLFSFIMRQINSTHVLLSYFFEIYFQVNSLLRLDHLNGLCRSGFLIKTLYESNFPSTYDGIRWGVRNKKLLAMQYSSPYHLISHRPKYRPQHLNLTEQPRPTFFPECERPSLTPV